MCGEQWHGPGVGVIPELARVARQQLTELGIRKGRRRARTTGSFAISQRRWRSFGKIPLDPAIDRAAFYTRMLGNDGNRRTFCNLGNCPKAPIKSGVVRLRKRLQQASTLRPTERRIARSGCVHPDTIGSARACRKTSGYLLTAYRRLVGTSIAAVPEEASGILSGDAVEGGSKRLLQGLEGVRGDPPQMGFHLGPSGFNRAEVRAVGRQIAIGKA